MIRGLQTPPTGIEHSPLYAVDLAPVPEIQLSAKTVASGLTTGRFIAFGCSWALTMYFVWSGTESIRILETLAAPIPLGVGVLLVFWGAHQGGGFAQVLDQSAQLERPTAHYRADGGMSISPLQGLEGKWKADSYRIAIRSELNGSHDRALAAL